MVGKPRQATTLRGPEEWEKERPLTYFYRGDKIDALKQLAWDYLGGKISYEQLKAQVPLQTRWLRGSEPQKRRCQGENVLLVLGWCTPRNVPVNLDHAPEYAASACLTEKFVMGIERIVEQRCLFLDLFPVSTPKS